MVMAPRPMRETSSPPKEMCFIGGSKLVVDVVHPMQPSPDGPGKSLMKGVLARHLPVRGGLYRDDRGHVRAP